MERSPALGELPANHHICILLVLQKEHLLPVFALAPFAVPFACSEFEAVPVPALRFQAKDCYSFSYQRVIEGYIIPGPA